MNSIRKSFSIFFKKTFKKSIEKDVKVRQHFISSNFLQREVRIDLYLPPIYKRPGMRTYPVVFFNDGQDMAAVQLVKNLEQLYKKERIQPLIVVAIHAADRMQEYGTIDQPDYEKRGSKATAYSQFVLDELLPFVRTMYRVSKDPALNSFAGFSLGGLSAFDLAWNYPRFFQIVGVFSGALWWRSQPFQEEDPDADRIVHTTVENSRKREGMRFWLQTGTKDETSDRNNNGIIDSIDDTNDLIAALEEIGYQNDGKEIQYVEVADGEHNQQTWGKILPDFLIWAFGK
ncbi:MAG: alpha/beta hydrolase [Saprospiraceae bacterium]